MALIPRPTRITRWAESGNQVEPSTEKQEIGWIIEKPPNETMNWIHFEQDTAVQYLLQEVGAEWFIEQPYSATSQVTYNGVRYKSKLANIGKQPDVSPDVWEIAYSDYSLTLDYNNTVNVVNFADKLVYKDEPIFRAKAVGTGYQASAGVTDNVGYNFSNFTTDGLFHNNSPVMLRRGVEVARFEPVASMNENNKKVVTMDVLQAYLQQYKVGDVYITTVNENPSVRLGYGTWVRCAKGRAVVGFSDDTSSSTPDWVKVGGNQHGTYTHTLTLAQLPKMRPETLITRAGTHRTDSDWQYLGEADGHANDGVPDSIGYMKAKEIGGGLAHNIVQPSEVFYLWKRTA